ncbi:large conductance mechanosensitive channel protein MscL [uncultured Ruthenibacterium sp.]|uniref:large conductance mechanosensitive channel protein MscL n=1 Tax=uncultured Ruthenibacterium sp. TaxID=1905347 RepID=UPI00349E59E2
MKRWLREFRAFALKGNVIDMAVGVVVGSSFTAIVNSLVGDVITPLFMLLSPDSSTFESLTIGGTIMIGKFINAVLSFLMISVCMFILMQGANRLLRRAEKEKAEAPAPAPSKEELLLTEIRDLLKENRER